MGAITFITDLIKDIGFPFAMCILMFMQMNKQSERHEVETKALAEALNNNTSALSEVRMTMAEMFATKEKE